MNLKSFEKIEKELKDRNFKDDEIEFLRGLWKKARNTKGLKQLISSMFKWYRIESKYTDNPCKAEERWVEYDQVYHKPMYVYVKNNDDEEEIEFYCFYEQISVKILRENEGYICNKIEEVDFIEGNFSIYLNLEDEPIANINGKYIILRVDDSFVFKKVR